MHQAIVDPATFDVEDSDEEDDVIRNIGSSSISTLEAIKTKLIRRPSKASNSGRHSQRSAVGNSSEELARRAELKRLMHKRIQEELKSEEEVVTPRDLVQSRNHESGSQSGLPGGGPRDTIEFSVDEMNEIRDNGFKYASWGGIALALPVDETQALALGRRSSRLEPTCRSGDTIGTENYAAPNERGSISQMPPSPELCPVNLSSPRGSGSEHSWCLSYSHSHLASVLGIQEDFAHQPSECNGADDGTPEEEGPKDGSDSRTQEKPANSKENATGQDSPDSVEQPHRSPRPGGIDPASEQGVKSDDKEQQDSDTALYQDSSLDLWLRSQELQSSLSSSTQRSRSTALGKLCESYSRDMEAMATGDAVKPHTTPATPEVHQDAATRNHLPSAWLQSRDTQADAKKTNDLAEANTPNITGTGGNHIVTLDQPPTVAHEELSSHYVSSRYTTMPNSAQSSHRSSLRSLVELFGSSKGASIFSPFSPFYRPTTADRRTETDESGVSSYKTAQNALPARHVGAPNVHPSQQHTAQTYSQALSDTSSFKQREEELRSVKQRFGQSQFGRGRNLPAVSKFREEFDDSRVPIGAKVSILSKLHLHPVRKARYARDLPRMVESDGEIFQNPSALQPQQTAVAMPMGARKRSISFDKDQKPHVEESATGKWKRALRTEAERRQTRRRDSLSKLYTHDPEEDQACAMTNEQETTKHIRENNTADNTDDDHPSPRAYSPTSAGNTTLKPPVDIQCNRTPVTDISGRLFRTWSRQLSRTPSPQALPAVHVVGGRQEPRRFSTPPESWAKWPSHNRTERTGPAGENDIVVPRDFVSPHPGGFVGTTVGAKTQSRDGFRSGRPRTFSSSLGRAVKNKVTKIIPGRNEFPKPHNSRGKQIKYLEYPELELLPMQGGYKDVQALEDQIETMKNGSSRAEGKPRNPSILGVRLIQDVQNLRYGNDDAHTSDANEHPAAIPPHRPPPVVSCTVSGTTAKRSGTPPSHVSYDDCVPKHMLDENDSIKSHDTVLVKRSQSHVSRGSGPAIINDRTKYMTWNGRSRRQPVLLQSTIDFGAELDDMLTAARAKAMQVGNGEDMQKATAV
ncbi:hypothetical protein DL765_011756 [Monosporascus sp. GIB2]|nr:hypothetical protein DL765_011756 [Monosporascus sp. GIB2]